jgi:hypothetical protein
LNLFLELIMSKADIVAPPSPPNGPLDWSKAVRGNAFANIERLGQWIGGTKIPENNDPSASFATVAPQSLGAGSTPPTIHVLVHGWAPGYRSVVDAQNGRVLWWGANAHRDGAWPSDFAWLPASAQSLQVNSTGLLQSIVAQDSQAIALAYSWLDDSATDTGPLDLLEVYQSEAYTHINGLRLADALEQAIAPSFWNAQTGLLHLIGHSHGSKVATVAALTLQQRGYRVAHLTILDSPEGDLTLAANGANLLGFYFERLGIGNPSSGYAANAFVDNYTSCFGVGYAGDGDIGNIVETALDPSPIYAFDDLGARHGYAATWYGGAAAGAASQGEPPLGLAWPPAPKNDQPALNQNWPGDVVTERAQWSLQAGTSIRSVFAYGQTPLAVEEEERTKGSVSGDPSTKLVFVPATGGWPAYSIFKGRYYNRLFDDGYGLGVDISWTSPQPGDYLVVTVESPEFGGQEAIAVLDGASLFAGSTSIAIPSFAWDELFSLSFYVYFLAAEGNTTGRVELSNFRLVTVRDADERLRALRLKKAKDKKRVSADDAEKEVAS